MAPTHTGRDSPGLSWLLGLIVLASCHERETGPSPPLGRRTLLPEPVTKRVEAENGGRHVHLVLDFRRRDRLPTRGAVSSRAEACPEPMVRLIARKGAVFDHRPNAGSNRSLVHGMTPPLARRMRLRLRRRP